MRTESSSALRIAACALLAFAATTGVSRAQDKMYFPATDNTVDVIVQYINNENVRLDISAWYLTEHAISQAIVARFRAGVPVRVIGDRVSIFEIDRNTKLEFYYLANYGVPIRLRYNPTWYPEIDHWKFAYFKGQGVVEFGSANWATYELKPASSSNYSDETMLFTSDPILVSAFATKFDTIWNDTTAEPESKISKPPYLKNWWDACASEPNCSDFSSFYSSPAQMSVDNSRQESPDAFMPPDLIWGQGPDFNNRLTTEINNEASRIKFVVYRLTVDNITTALAGKVKSGVPVQIIIEPNEYGNRKWPEFWITHANIDKLWAAGASIKQRAHSGLTHMKMLVTSTYATNASSNYAAAWQRDHDYFVSASGKPTIYQAMSDRFDKMWADTIGFTSFVPGPADAPVLASPSTASTGVSTQPTFTWNTATFATSYDVWLGTSTSNMKLVANVAAQLTNNPPKTYSWRPSTALATGTQYLWKVVSRTFAADVRPSLLNPSDTWSFVTSGTPSAPPPSSLPSGWSNLDIGSTGIAGSASYSNGVFTVSGAGADIWGTSDSFQYVYQPLSTDGQIIAHVTSEQNTSTYAKAGVMLRSALTASASHVILDRNPSGSIEFMTRADNGGSTQWVAGANQALPAWLKLVRSGGTVTGYVSADGSSWAKVGSTPVTMGSSIYVGLVVCSHTTSALNTSTFDNVSITTGGSTAPPPSSSPTDVVVYASDIPASSIHGIWKVASDSTSPNSTKLATDDAAAPATSAPAASPIDYVDVTFNADAGTPYTIWLRLQALGNSKYNDSVWVQFSDAQANGSQVYAMNTTTGLLVNLATDSTGSSLNGWGWQNKAYWLSQPTTITFATTGQHTLRIQVREDGVQFDQIVLSPTTYLTAAPGPVGGDSTIVAK